MENNESKTVNNFYVEYDDSYNPTIKSKGSECTILTVLGTHLNKNFKKK